jgi:hypothetical protein
MKTRSVIELISLWEIFRDATPSRAGKEAIERRQLLSALTHVFRQPLADVARNALAGFRRFHADPGGDLFLQRDSHVFHGSLPRIS